MPVRRRQGAASAVLAGLLFASVVAGCGSGSDATVDTGGTAGGTAGSATCSEGSPVVGGVAAADGTPQWTACSKEEAWRTVIGEDGDIVVVSAITEPAAGDQRTTIRAYDAASGEERWSFVPGGPNARVRVMPLAGPVSAQGVAVVAWAGAASDQTPMGGPGAVVGLDTATGKTRWEVPLTAGPGVEEVVALTPSTVVLGGRTMRGLDRQTGAPTWQQSGGAPLNTFGPAAAVDGETVILPTTGGLVSFDGSTGQIQWRVAGSASLLPGSVALADGVIVGSVGNGPNVQIRAFHAADGRDLWAKPGRLAYGGAWAVGDGVVVVLDPTNGALVAFELRTGEERWRHERTATERLGEPQVIAGTGVVALWEGELAVLSTTDGSVSWSATQPFDSSMMSSTIVAGGTVVVTVNTKPWRD